MFTKIFMVSAIVALANAQHYGQIHHAPLAYAQPIAHLGHGIHGHGHAVSSQSIVSHAVPAHQPHLGLHGLHGHHEESYHHPSYKFSYSVHDGHTGDVKSQDEHREGDHVNGQYSLVEPNGNVRHVAYSADDHSGFNAVVSNSHGHH